MDVMSVAYEFVGTHVFADIYDVPAEHINDNELILQALRTGISDSGATICSVQTKEFEPSGFTAVFLLSESHVAVHTYPDTQSLFIDTFTCGTTCKPEKVVEVLVDSLQAGNYRMSVIQRGMPSSTRFPAELPGSGSQQEDSIDRGAGRALAGI
ncbi:adenosylmethionine decarboxylase [Streptomyces sp. NPDC005065]|uniref:adenosylmethionine decarboxylase n=1 Tax=Streptomyces sp. NPDC005065 TaxID=3154461 RepID=UPI0033BB52A6